MKKVLFGLLSFSVFSFSNVDTSGPAVDGTTLFNAVGSIPLQSSIKVVPSDAKYIVFASLNDPDPAQGFPIAGLGNITFTNYSTTATFDGGAYDATGKVYVRKVTAPGVVEELTEPYKISVGGNNFNESLYVDGGNSTELPIFKLYSDSDLATVFASGYTVKDGSIYLGESVDPTKIMNTGTIFQVNSTARGDISIKLIANPNPSGSAVTVADETKFFNDLNAGQTNLQNKETPIYIKVGK